MSGSNGRDPAGNLEGGHLIMRNEFAIVKVGGVGPAERRRLRIEDMRSGVSVELDALELESLAWARHLDLAPLLDPNLTRWRSGHPEDEL